METREEKLAWCKRRALSELEQEEPRGVDLDPLRKANCIASFVSDANKHNLYDADKMGLLMLEATMYRHTHQAMVAWVEGFG